MPAKKYDWEAWFGRDRFRLLRGRDYSCSQGAMAQQIRQAASKLGVSVHVVESESGFSVFVAERRTCAEVG